MEAKSTDNLKIRYAGYDDLPYVKALQYKLIDETSVGDKKSVESFLENALSNVDCHVRVCEYEGSIISTATLEIVRNTYSKKVPSFGWICGVITDAKYRGKGIASILLTSLIQTAVKEGCSILALDCGHERVSFYKRFGFEIDRKIPDGYRMVRYNYKPV